MHPSLAMFGVRLSETERRVRSTDLSLTDACQLTSICENKLRLWRQKKSPGLSLTQHTYTRTCRRARERGEGAKEGTGWKDERSPSERRWDREWSRMKQSSVCVCCMSMDSMLTIFHSFCHVTQSIQTHISNMLEVSKTMELSFFHWTLDLHRFCGLQEPPRDPWIVANEWTSLKRKKKKKISYSNGNHDRPLSKFLHAFLSSYSS